MEGTEGSFYEIPYFRDDDVGFDNLRYVKLGLLNSKPRWRNTLISTCHQFDNNSLGGLCKWVDISRLIGCFVKNVGTCILKSTHGNLNERQ